ncbi:MAG: phosphate ABC transporter substrate-binding protein PstS [Gallionellaceae bacterium]|nr:phosphate ABC transporter substrate-binding protein PstS [Gallionellaceae bacterium]
MQVRQRLLAAMAMTLGVLLPAVSKAVDITGAGATFPYPIYAKWADAYKTQTGIGLNYQSIGSGGGIKQITAKTVDFGASDMPMKPEDLEKNGLMQFPAVMGGVVPVVNINGVEAGKLKLDSKVLADIFLGKIIRWNDPAIAELNKDAKFPDELITVVHRSDGSGTSFIFTNYLSKVSPEWKSAVGEGTAVSWKVGTGGKGNEGVASYVQRIKNSIGYVEYAYALQNKMTYVQLKNRGGEFVKPDDSSFKAAAASAHWDKAPGFYELLTDEPGKESWPITGATFILMHKVQDKPETALAVLKFFDWAYKSGAKMASDLDYVPMPERVQQLVRAAWKAQIKDQGGKVIME